MRRYGPYDLIVGADGARSTMRRFLPLQARIHEHRWGALWGVFPDPSNAFHGVLDQYFDGARRMAGFLPDRRRRGVAVLVDPAGPDRGRAGGRRWRRSATICCRWRPWRSR